MYWIKHDEAPKLYAWVAKEGWFEVDHVVEYYQDPWLKARVALQYGSTITVDVEHQLFYNLQGE